MKDWLISTTKLLIDNNKKEHTKSYVKKILCLLIIFFKINLLRDFCKKPEHTDLIRSLLRGLAIDSLSVFEAEVKIFLVAYETLLLDSLLTFVNEAINFTTEWIFAIGIIHLLTQQHDNMNNVEWKEDHSKFKYVYFYSCKSAILIYHVY